MDLSTTVEVLSLCAQKLPYAATALTHTHAPYVYFIDWILDQEEEEPHWIRGSHTLTLYDNKLLLSSSAPVTKSSEKKKASSKLSYKVEARLSSFFGFLLHMSIIINNSL